MESISAPSLFWHNLRATLTGAILGVLSFSILGILLYLANTTLVGGVLGLFHVFGFAPAELLLWGILPHGVFELSAILLSCAAVMRMGLSLVTPQAERTIGEVVLQALAEWSQILIGLVIPLLAIAALVETYITPGLLCKAIELTCQGLR